MARQCNACKEWNTIAEEIIQNKIKWHGKANPTSQSRTKPLKINEIDATEEIEWTQLTPN
jgi:DNA repair protein RadA/Sms